MDDEEKKFQEIKTKIEEFQSEFKELMNKFNFGIDESYKYNGIDECCGIDYYFVVEGKTWYGQTITELLGIVDI